MQLTSDGHKPYLIAVEEAFGGDVDYAMIVKEYGPGDDSGSQQAHRRYSPGTVNGVEKTVVVGSPNLDLISTSYAERSNLTLRMSMRRFTRLTNGFSKKLANHALMVALFTAYYNFCRPHKTLGKIHTTPGDGGGSHRPRVEAGRPGGDHRRPDPGPGQARTEAEKSRNQNETLPALRSP